MDTAVPQCDAQQKGIKSEKENVKQQQTGNILSLCCYTIAICESSQFSLISGVLKLQN